MPATRHAPTRHARTAWSVRGEGPPILLIHGAEATRTSFEPLAALLSARLTVYSYDQRGCGETESDSEPRSILDLVEDAAQLVEALGLARTNVLGTSFGGRIAQGLAIRHPAQVDRLVLCNTWPLDVSLDTAHAAGTRHLQALRAALPGSARELAETFYGSDHAERHPELVARMARRAGQAAGSRGTLARSTAALRCEDIAAPTLLVAGSRDVVVPPRLMHEMQARIRGSRIVDVEGGHHAITVERPAAVAHEVEAFLASSAR